jgi:hypothetical protein
LWLDNFPPFNGKYLKMTSGTWREENVCQKLERCIFQGVWQNQKTARLCGQILPQLRLGKEGPSTEDSQLTSPPRQLLQGLVRNPLARAAVAGPRFLNYRYPMLICFQILYVKSALKNVLYFFPVIIVFKTLRSRLRKLCSQQFGWKILGNIDNIIVFASGWWISKGILERDKIAVKNYLDVVTEDSLSAFLGCGNFATDRLVNCIVIRKTLFWRQLHEGMAYSKIRPLFRHFSLFLVKY